MDKTYAEWLLVIAIGLSIVALGAILDFFLKDKEVRVIHDRLYKWSTLISDLPLLEWQIRIARKAESFLSFITDISIGKNIENTNIKNNNEHETVTRVKINRSQRIKNYIVIAIIVSISWVTIYTIYKNMWIFQIFGILGIFILLPLIVMFQQVFFSNERLGIIIQEISFVAIVSSFFSCIITTIAIVVSKYLIPTEILDSHWFHIENKSLVVTRPFLLASINYIFDFLTIWITLHLLRSVISRKRNLALASIVDILASYILMITLYTGLTIITPNNELSIIDSLLHSLNSTYNNAENIVNLIYQSKEWHDFKWEKDLHLTPVLSSTFAPVTVYMSVFFAISLLKPFVWITARFFSVISSREESVFKQLGTLITLIMAAAKAVFDYLTIQP
ncbi:hypothetical protein [Motiliproteus sediminis]|uniref:hypothetical protein n=1 Tax=Motiliproteus sediminis TaxID=1468178 RepID=UPI001AEFCD8B|nr:hypothetical protein [Motiliproteus sediminis]